MLFLTYKAQRLNNNNKTNNFKLIAQAGKDSLTLNSCSLSFPVTEQGSEKKLEFQLALQTSSSQILLAPGKSYIYFFFFIFSLQTTCLVVAHWAGENEILLARQENLFVLDDQTALFPSPDRNV